MKNKIYKTIICAVLALAMAINVPVSVKAETLQSVKTSAEGYVIYDATDDKIILGKNETTAFYPASITKIMTALLVCENISDLSQTITFTDAALAEMTSDSSHLPGVMAVSGEVMTYKDALYGMYMVSANECAAQLGISIAGSTAAFADMMNAKAAALGCTGTHFTNAHGLHAASHTTTPADMAKIFAAALKNKTFFEMATTYTYIIEPTNKYGASREMVPGHNILNGNIYYPEVFAGKTGRTDYAGRTLATAAKFGTHTVIIIEMKATDTEFYNDTLKLLEYARGYYDGLYTDMTWTEKNDTVYVYGTNTLSVRDYPAAVGTNIVDHLPYGTAVTRTASWGDWSQIVVGELLLYVYNSYLTSDVPPQEFDPETAIKTTTRAIVIVTFDEKETEDVTAEAAQSTTENPYKYTGNVDDLIAGDETAATKADPNAGLKKGDISSGWIRTIMIICIVLMVLIAALYIMTEINEKKKKEARRQARLERARKEQELENRKKRYRKDFSNKE